MKIEHASIEICVETPYTGDYPALRQLHDFLSACAQHHFYGKRTSEITNEEVEKLLNKSIGLVYLLAHLNVKVI